jgi:adenylate cyclase
VSETVSEIPPAGRRLAILFTDVEGSTELRNRRGDQAADGILRIHEAIVRRQIGEHAGEEVLFLGDGFMASFAAVPAALRSAVGIQRALEEHNVTDPSRRVRVRIGVHVGDVTLRDGTLFGQAVHAAARVAAVAAGGQILVSAAVRR